MPQVRTFDSKQIVLTVGGIPIGGFADGTFLQYEDDEDAFTKVTGADGVVSRSKTNNSGGTLTITVAQTSPSNDILSNFANADKLSNTGVIPVVVKDINGTTNIFAPNGWVRKKAPLEWSKEITDNEWILDLADVDSVIGGNVIP